MINRYTRQATSQFYSSIATSSITGEPRMSPLSVPKFDVLVVPTAPTHPTVEAVLADPIALNSMLGTFTHFGNVLDLNAVAVPAGTYPARELISGKTEPEENEGITTEEAQGQLPFSITFLGAGGSDAEVLRIAGIFEPAVIKSLGKDYIALGLS